MLVLGIFFSIFKIRKMLKNIIFQSMFSTVFTNTFELMSMCDKQKYKNNAITVTNDNTKC